MTQSRIQFEAQWDGGEVLAANAPVPVFSTEYGVLFEDYCVPRISPIQSRNWRGVPYISRRVMAVSRHPEVLASCNVR